MEKKDKHPVGLLVECATANCSVAINCGERILADTESRRQYDHASQLLLLIEQCLQTADIGLSTLDYIAVSMGPGSYTGLRIGMSSAKALCMALDIPLLGISTLQIIAAGVPAPASKIPVFKAAMIDARRDEVYLGVFDEENRLQGFETPFIINHESIESLIGQYHPILWCGDGAFKVSKYVSISSDSQTISNKGPKAIDMSSLGYQKFIQKSFLEIFSSSPIYLKSPNITQAKPKLSH